MATRTVTLAVTIKDKDEYAGGDGRLPEPGEVERHLGDYLADQTKHDFELPWRVLRVEEA